jgi:tripartite-type tricarboxylate transporter receptor subunit TctC
MSVAQRLHKRRFELQKKFLSELEGVMNVKIRFFAIFTTALLFFAASPGASADEFYKNKKLRFIVGFDAGGGYDVFTRVVARHVDKHIPGKPSVTVENMPGAGSLIAANYIAGKAKPDGLTAGVFSSGLITQQAMGAKEIRFDARKFRWIGSMSSGTPVCAIMAFTGLKTFDDVLSSKKQLRIGSTGPGTTSHDLAKLMVGLMNAPFKIVSGYKGTSEIRIALQRKEVDGACWTWESMSQTAQSMLDASGDERLIPYVIQGKSEDPLTKGLPQFTAKIKDQEKLTAFKAWLEPYEFFRPLALPPETPKDRVQILRTALKKTMDDPAFLAEVKKSQLDVHHTSGEDVEKNVEQILAIPPKPKQILASLLAEKKA